MDQANGISSPTPSDRIFQQFHNYPEPRKGPDIPNGNDRQTPVALRGRIVVVAAWLLETFGPLRRYFWKSAGFGSLHRIRKWIEDYEPRYEPNVIPIAGPEPATAGASVRPDHNSIGNRVNGHINGSAAGPSQPLFYSVADYHALYTNGEITPLDVVHVLLPLIRRDLSPPGEHSTAWFAINVDEVLAAAAASTQRYRNKAPLGILDGVPTAIKDDYDIEGYSSSHGSRNDYVGTASHNGSVTNWCVRHLQDAGAVVLGKLSMHEFGLDTTGNNPIYGTPRNPYCNDHYTGGSSSGSAYAVASGLLPIAVGSDGGGSVRIPSAFCGVFGLKPTHGRLSFRPNVNYCLTCSVNGPIAADMSSLIAAFECVGAPDPVSPFSRLPPFVPSPPESRARLLGLPTAWIKKADPEVRRICMATVERLQSQHGYRTVPIEIPCLDEGQIAHALTILTDAATLLPDTHNLTPANRILIALGGVTPSVDYLLAQKLRGLLMQHLSYLWRAHPGMLLITPTTRSAGWRIHGTAELAYGLSDGDSTTRSMEYAWLANFCGLPSISLPTGYLVPERRPRAGLPALPEDRDCLPVSFMATAEWGAEHSLLELGLEVEEFLSADGRRRPPVWVDLIARARAAAASSEGEIGHHDVDN